MKCPYNMVRFLLFGVLIVVCNLRVREGASVTCPDGELPVNCLVNPCDTNKCRCYPEAECVPDYCGGCHAIFRYQSNNVTSMCEDCRIDWKGMARDRLKIALRVTQNTNVAKNVILFVGDGMGQTTVTASRILKGQLQGRSGEDTELQFEKFPYVALSKTYGSNKQVPDSAATATALVCGVKANWYTFGVDDSVIKNNCTSQHGHEVKSVLQYSLEEGKATGLVSTARLTHATPASSYGHTANRKWEGDSQMDGITGGCKDIAWQYVYDSDVQVAFSGGRRYFLPNTVPDPETNVTYTDYQRRDGINLIEVWKEKQSNKSRNHAYVWNKGQFDAINPDDTDFVLGLFEPGYMQYEVDRDSSSNGEPSIAEMTEKAIKILRKNPKGYFLFIEGARIDHAHHAGIAKRALLETIAFEAAVKKAVELTDEKDTLILVTADHSHAFDIGGYPRRGNDILGLSEPQADEIPLDGKPYTTLQYANGPGYVNGSRQDLTNVDTRHIDFKQQSLLPFNDETHGGEDVAIYARGPMSHLIHGVVEEHYVAHMMAYASCVGENKDHCKTKPKPNPPTCVNSGSKQYVCVPVLLVVIMIAKYVGVY